MPLRKKSVVPYFRVSGERREHTFDEAKGRSIPTGVVLPPATRFESIDVRAAEDFATDVYRKENIVCEIHEVAR